MARITRDALIKAVTEDYEIHHASRGQVARLAKTLGATEATVRRHLKAAAAEGQIELMTDKTYDRQPDHYGQGLFGGAGACVRRFLRATPVKQEAEVIDADDPAEANLTHPNTVGEIAEVTDETRKAELIEQVLSFYEAAAADLTRRRGTSGEAGRAMLSEASELRALLGPHPARVGAISPAGRT